MYQYTLSSVMGYMPARTPRPNICLIVLLGMGRRLPAWYSATPLQEQQPHHQ